MEWEAKLTEHFDGQKKLWEEYKKTIDTELKTIKGSTKSFSPEAQEKIDKMEKGFDEYEVKIKEVTDAIDKQKKENKALEDQVKEMEKKLNRPKSGSNGGYERKDFVTDYLYKEATQEKSEEKSLATWEALQFPNTIAPEKKAMTFNDPETGGYLGPPEFVNEIIKELREITPALQIAKTRTTSRNSMTFPKKTGTTTARRRGESEPKTESDPVKYGAEQVTLPEMYAFLDVSTMDLDDTAFNLEAEIREELIDAFNAKLGDEFINGTGPLQMEGMLVNADVVITNSGDANNLTDDAIIQFIEAGLQQQYKVNARIMFNLNTLGKLRILEDGAGNKLWVPGFDKTPNSILGKQYIISEDMPDVAADAFPILYGDYKKGYQIGNRTRISILRIVDSALDALGQVRFSGTWRVGGRITQANAIKKMKISA